MDSNERRIQEAQAKKEHIEKRLELARVKGNQAQIQALQYELICSIDALQRLLYRRQKRAERNKVAL